MVLFLLTDVLWTNLLGMCSLDGTLGKPSYNLVRYFCVLLMGIIQSCPVWSYTLTLIM